MSATDTRRGVPGVPLAALDAIQDQNTRQVLQSIIDGWHVRNGVAGNGDSRFITASELGEIKGSIGGLTASLSALASETQNPPSLTGAQINRIINDLQASVMESALWKTLGERITLLDDTYALEVEGLAQELNTMIGEINNISVTSTSASARQLAGVQATVYNKDTGLAAAHSAIIALNDVSATSTSANARYLFSVNASVADAVGSITTEQGVRVNQDNVLATAINTVWAAIGDNSALVQNGSQGLVNNAGAVAQSWNQTQAAIKDPNTGAYISSAAVRQETRTVANKAGDLEAQWTVKTDINGYVSGFGLASTSNNSTPTSDFIIRADRFSIGNPSTPATTTNWAGTGSITSGVMTIVKMSSGQIKLGSSVTGNGVEGSIYVTEFVNGSGGTGTYKVSTQTDVSDRGLSGEFYEPPGVVPFIVTTTPTLLPDGTTRQAGVYMNYSMVNRLDGAYIYAAMMEAGKIYTGSQYIDHDSKLPINAVASATWQVTEVGGFSSTDGNYRATSTSIAFFGPAYHSMVNQNQRVKSGRVYLQISANGTIDHYFSLWYRVNGSGWRPLSMVVEPQNDYGSASINYAFVENVVPGYYIEFGLAATNTSYVCWNTGKPLIKYLTINVAAINL